MIRVFWLVLVSAALTQAQGLEDPGFENGGKGWTIAEKIPCSTFSEAGAHEGKLGLHIADEAAGASANVGSAHLAVKPGQTVTLGFWARTDSEPLAALMLKAYNKDNRPIEGPGSDLTIPIRKRDGDWQHYDQEYTVPEGAVTIGLGIRTWKPAVGTVDFDDFELKIE